jgi:hypothetical protein
MSFIYKNKRTKEVAMVDFTKLMNRTPEEKEADRKEIEDRYARMEADDKALIEERTGKIEQLMACIDTLPGNHAKFIHDLDYQSRTFDMDRCVGGKLAKMSEKQVNYLNGLLAQYAPSSDDQSASAGDAQSSRLRQR